MREPATILPVIDVLKILKLRFEDIVLSVLRIGCIRDLIICPGCKVIYILLAELITKSRAVDQHLIFSHDIRLLLFHIPVASLIFVVSLIVREVLVDLSFSCFWVFRELYQVPIVFEDSELLLANF